MKVGDSVRLSIDDWERNEAESAMLHACNAVDGTAAKVYGRGRSAPGVAARFTELIRDNYAIFGPMGLPGIDLANTRFPVNAPRSIAGTHPDVADIIYSIHRCAHGHGDELPQGFHLLEDAAGQPRLTRIEVTEGAVRLSDRAIFGLLAVAIASPYNADQVVPEGYHLTFEEQVMPINEWWGRKEDMEALVSRTDPSRITMDFGDWMP